MHWKLLQLFTISVSGEIILAISQISFSFHKSTTKKSNSPILFGRMERRRKKHKHRLGNCFKLDQRNLGFFLKKMYVNYGSPKEILKKTWQIYILLLRHLQDLLYKMTKAREAEGASIHKEQTSNYIPTEKLSLHTK